MQMKSDQITKLRPEITGTTRVLGLIGRDISYSLSPIIHNFSAAQLNEDCVCIPFDVDALSVKSVLDALWSMGGVGASITTPHKEAVAREVAGKLGSVNSIYRSGSYWAGQSTDAEGLANAIKRMGLKMNNFKHVVILGNGGVTLAIVEYLRSFPSLSELTIIRRSPDRDALLSNALIPNERIIKFLPFQPDSLESALADSSGETLVIQATNAPYHGDDLARFCPAINGLNGAVVDLIYSNPSKLIDKAKELNLPCQDGLPMLIEQALLSQQRWWGKSADYQSVFEMLKHVIK